MCEAGRVVLDMESTLEVGCLSSGLKQVNPGTPSLPFFDASSFTVGSGMYVFWRDRDGFFSTKVPEQSDSAKYLPCGVDGSVTSFCFRLLDIGTHITPMFPSDSFAFNWLIS